MTTAELLRDAIDGKWPGIGLRAAAKKLKVPPGNLSEWLNGVREPNLGSLRFLAKKLGREPGELCGTTEAKS